ncbi:transcription factor TFIIIB subunit brf1 [Exophiala xenobiotica]|nr:transcription factor TFIIIB subunit brf1 [Exophiala xenobiotica]KAK5226725.1 transcription factor TFIIIB subunit brf1 [Exophiala xenobiotica]KAK5300472.1 transcription factor TFIIIB subunit brf1 [Exophiala xenobiotica]KAK5305981.1 transcription factor TFIIIB subunit brf1 [Exophiala xenobiotica]KAK5345373.1 transcription factor TFIIIB subunit brf1 [Exophiala xenobiotica]
MPALKPPPPKPRAGQHRRAIPRGRIEGLGSPAPGSFRATTPSFRRSSTPSIQRPTGGKILKCTNPSCPNPHVVESEQGLICDTCGAVALEESGLVSEQGFGETDSGAITALGVRVQDGQTHQRTYAPGGALGNVGREPTVNRERSEAHARTIMQSYQALLGVRQAEVDAGLQLFKLAWGVSFVQGRTIDSVAVVCLYLACRRKHEQIQNERRPMYSLMLIDFAEKLNVDVFALGKMYTDLVRKLFLQADGSVKGEVSSDLLAMGPEVLVGRFVDELEFDKAHRDKIKMDAIRIVQRMKRDWMSTGRRPSGVCGAAVILAARMNNYRRTTREVVLTAKVTEITINKRLEEFQGTESSKLSVSQFRNNSVLDSVVASDPPSYQKAHNPKPAKRKRGRPRKHPLPETAAEIEGSATPEPQGTQDPNNQEHPAKRVRVDADGYKIPDIPQRQIPIDPALMSADNSATSGEILPEQVAANSASPTRRQRALPWIAPPPSEAEIAIENEIEQDIQATLRENPELNPNHSLDEASQSRSSNDQAPAEPSDDGINPLNQLGPHVRDKRPGPAVDTNIGNTGYVSLSPTLKPDEFDSDEDVSMCMLSHEESQIKETIWVSMNADWLRQNNAKRIKQDLKEADMRARGLDPAKEALREKMSKGKRKDGTKKPGRRGDVSYLKKGGEGDADHGDRERSAAESVREMFKTRGVYSRRVNYDVLDSIYGIAGGDTSGDSRSESVVSDLPHDAREGSVASTVASPGPEAMFRANAGRASGRQRSNASLAAERREDKKRKEQRESQAREEREGSGASARGSRSRSPSGTPAGDEVEVEATAEPQPEAGGKSPEPETAEPEPEQQPTPPATQSRGPPPIRAGSGIPGVASSSQATSQSQGPPPIRTSGGIPTVASSSRSPQQQSTPPTTQSQGPPTVRASGGIPTVGSSAQPRPRPQQQQQQQDTPKQQLSTGVPTITSSSEAATTQDASDQRTMPEKEVADALPGTAAGQFQAKEPAAASPPRAQEREEEDTGDDDDDAEDESNQDPDEDDYVRDDVDEDIDAAFDGRYGDEDDDDY